MKKFLIVTGIMVIVLATPLFFLVANIDDLVRRAIERGGSQVFGTTVNVAEVGLDPGEGRGLIRDLVVSNPLGYSERPAASFAEIEVVYDFDTGVVNQVRVRQADIHVELRGGSSNFQDLADHAEAYQPPAPRPAPDAESAEQPGLRINLLVIEESRGTLVADFTDRSLEFEVDELRLSGLDGNRQELAQEIGRRLAQHVLREAATEVLKARALDKADEWKGKVKDWVDEL